MYTLTRRLSPRQLLLTQALPAGLALLVAEAFYKFHSFSLECAAFLAPWYVLEAVQSGARLLQVGSDSDKPAQRE